MNSIIMSLLVSVCGQVGISDLECPSLLTPKDVPAIAQHAIGSQSGKSYVLVNTSEFNRLTIEKQTVTLVHELAHHTYYQETGKTSLNHSNKWRKGCLALAKESGVSTSACKSSL